MKRCKTGMAVFGVLLAMLFSPRADILHANSSTCSGDLLVSFAGRLIFSFDKDWKFIREDARGVESPIYDNTTWEKVNLPHTWNATDTFDQERGYYRGIGWYRKTFRLGDNFKHRRIFLEADATSTITDVWVNGCHIGKFTGGYNGFYLDITSNVLFGSKENLLAIRVANIHRKDIPPGRKIPDYNLYGGICGNVRLVITNCVYIAPRGCFVSARRDSEKKWVVKVKTRIRNDLPTIANISLCVRMRDMAGTEVMNLRSAKTIASGKQHVFVQVSEPILEPYLWSPDDPYLYTVEVILYHDGRIVDGCKCPLGFRFYHFDPNLGFFLNGIPTKLKGVNRHQCYPGLGNCLPNSLHVKDAQMIKKLGANFVRTSHYPQAPGFLDACDEIGIMVLEEIATWQFMGKQKFILNANQMMKDMIRRDRNHPSIILWGMFNEGRSAKLFHLLQETAHEQDPTRPTTYAESRFDKALKLGTLNIPDVLGINYRLDKLAEFHNAFPQCKFFSSEFANADWAVRGNLETELKQAEVVLDEVAYIESLDFIAGGALWSFHDYGTELEVTRPVQKSGIVDMYRIRKEAYFALQSHWSSAPNIHIAGHWSWTGDEGRNKTIRTWSNCDTVELKVNGRSLGEKRGGGQLKWIVPFEPGHLTAIGRKDGQVVVDQCMTTGMGERIILKAEPQRISANDCEVSEILATIVDKQGNVVSRGQFELTFLCTGPGKIRGIGGDSHTLVIGGRGRIIVQATGVPGTIKVRALGRGLRQSRVLRINAYCEPRTKNVPRYILQP